MNQDESGGVREKPWIGQRQTELTLLFPAAAPQGMLVSPALIQSMNIDRFLGIEC